MKSLQKIALLLLMASTTSMLIADTEVIDGIEWRYKLSDGHMSKLCAILDSPAIPESSKGDVIIPEYLGGYPVEMLRYDTFSGCSNITSITINSFISPQLLQGNNFVGCDKLANLYVVDNNPYFSEIDGVLYDKAQKFFLCCPPCRKELLIPYGIIGGFDNYGSIFATTLERISIPGSIMNVDVFSTQNHNLRGIVFGKGTRSINVGFDDYYMGISSHSNLVELSIPSSVTKVSGIFNNLEDSQLWRDHDDGLIIIDGCLIGMKGVCPSYEISIPPYCRLIAESAFYKYSGTAYSGSPEVRWPELKKITIPSSVKIINGHVGENIEEILLEDGIERIDSGAFSCTNIKRIAIPGSVEIVNDDLFFYCSLLEDVIFINGVKNIASVAYGSSQTYIFKGCTNLVSVNFPQSVEAIGARILDDTKLWERQPDGIIVIDDCLLGVKGDLPITDVLEIPHGCRVIADQAFSIKTNGYTMTIESKCPEAKELIIPDGVETIGAYAFFGMTNLESVILPRSIKRIGEFAFGGCSKLREINIPASVTSLGTGVFLNTPIMDEAENGLVIIDKCVVGVKGDCPQDVLIPEGVRVICDYAFGYKEGSIYSMYLDTGEWKCFETVYIPDSVCSIGIGAFSECTNLTSIAIPRGITEINDKTFYNCSKLKNVSLPESISKIGYESFAYCDMLEELELHKEIEWKNIDEYAFARSPTLLKGMHIEPNIAGQIDVAFAKAQTVTGTLHDDNDNIVGMVQVKVRKATLKGVVKIHAAVTLLDGKRVSSKTVSIMRNEDGAGNAEIIFNAPIGAMSLKIDSDGVFVFENEDYYMSNTPIGGTWGKGNGRVKVEAEHLNVSGEVQDSLLPIGESFTTNGSRWIFAKAATVKLLRDKQTKEYALKVNTDKGKNNLSGIKLTYSAKTGFFKGSFKVYCVEMTVNGKKKLKKYTFKVTGVVANGKGYGIAICKKLAATWDVAIE